MSNDHIPTAEIIQDIKDTEAEIATLTREEKGFRMVGDRMSIFRADSRIGEIQRRADFIEKLKAILAERGVSYP